MGDKSDQKKTDGASIDHDSPFYVHPSDYPRQIHVNEPLTDGNYTDWSQEMTNFLFAQNKIGFVDGSIKKPDPNDGKYMAWMRADAMIKGWLNAAMEKEIRNSVKFADTAEEIWSDLKERFAKENAPRAYELKQSLTVTRQEGVSVSNYYTRLRVLWDELQSVLPTPKCSCKGCSCGVGKKLVELKEKEKLYEFLLGLDAEFSTIRTQILAMSPTPTLGAAYHLVSEDEQQRLVATGKKVITDSAAFQVSTGPRREQTQRPSKTSQKEVKRNSNDPVEHCVFCGKDGHNRDGCFKRIGYPEWWPGKKGEKAKSRTAACVEVDESPLPGLTREQYQQFLSMFGNKSKEDGAPTVNMAYTSPNANATGNVSYKNGSWVVDSGATDHITHNSLILENRTKNTHELPVTIPNGESVEVEGRGDYVLPSGTKINEVLYVPNFNYNLLSVSRLAKDLDCAVTFFPDFFVMQSLRSRTLIGSGRCKDGLYHMGMVEGKRQAMVVTMDTWHKRLGHASDSKLYHVNFLKNLSKRKDVFCDSCIKAKHTRSPFPISSIKTNDCFELLHCDIWGPYRTLSLTRASYFLTIVDDYSRAVWVFLLRHKSEASLCLIGFHKLVKTQFDKIIKRIRSDNGGEFTSNKMLDFYAKEGIILETTCPHTPQQNGVVERKHRHLLETARALKFEANLPTRFWGECILTAAYLINHLPSDVIGNKTPFEMLHNEEPDYDFLRVFGCLAYYKSTETKGDKFELRGRPGVFLGYPRGTKGYKVYDVKNQKMVISRDVKFIETVYPFTNATETTTKEEIFRFPTSWDETMKEELKQNVGVVHDERQEEQSPYGPHDQEQENDTLGHGNEEAQNDTLDQENEEAQSDIFDQDNEVTQYDTPGPMNNLVGNESETQNGAHTHINETNTQPFKEKRNRVPPKRFADYHVKLPPSIDHAQPEANQESSTAVKDPNWREAMKREIQALEANETWTLKELPEGKRAIDSKWVYKIKYKPNGEIERYKARLVAKGFTQMEGVDYHETFAPVAKLVTVRTLLTIAIKRNWIIHQLDVNNAFLHGDLDEEVYMKIPQGFCKNNETKVCKLQKSLYGLKQASRNWYHKFSIALIDIGFKQAKSDHSLFVYKKDDVHVTALIYVDDVIMAGNNLAKIQQVKAYLDQKFSIKDLGTLKYFLGIEVARTKEGLVLSQQKYTLDILKDCGLQGCRPSSFPMEQSLKLDHDEGGPRVDASQYRRLIGRLLYLQATRPDLAYSVNVLSQFVANPRQVHLDAANRVLRYLKNTPGQGILLPNEGGTKLIAYCDSDWLGCPLTRKSRTGYLLLLGGGPVSWKSKKQSVVSRSSVEAEYRAMASTVSEVLWMRWLLEELDDAQTEPTVLFCDNQAARHIANNPVFHERTKHVEMDCYFVRERVESKEIQPQNIHSKSQIADLLTKALGAQQLRFLLGKLGVRNLHAPS
ncbi:putative RNA-directed DNA polymerase [Helianthus annuus]|nr:putative RNA-directed DNA polymerase [Helianthus annuus]